MSAAVISKRFLKWFRNSESTENMPANKNWVCLICQQWRFWGLHFFFGGGEGGVAIIAAGEHWHSEPSLTSGKLCFIINFLGATGGGRIFAGGGAPPPILPLNRPCLSDVYRNTGSGIFLALYDCCWQWNDHARYVAGARRLGVAESWRT